MLLRSGARFGGSLLDESPEHRSGLSFASPYYTGMKGPPEVIRGPPSCLGLRGP